MRKKGTSTKNRFYDISSYKTTKLNLNEHLKTGAMVENKPFKYIYKKRYTSTQNIHLALLCSQENEKQQKVDRPKKSTEKTECQ